MKKSRKIFIGISETSGFYGRLYCGLKQMGVDCFFAELTPNRHSYSYKFAHGNFLTKVCQKCYGKYSHIYKFFKFIIFIWALIRFDTFVFVGCQSFWGNKELKIYRKLHKKVVMVCLGWMTRLPYANGTDISINKSNSFNINYLIHETERRQKIVECIEKYVDVFINLPAQAQLNKKKFISFSYLGIALDLEDAESPVLENISKSNKIRILHAASTFGCRGTVEFEECISRLQEKYDIDYIELREVAYSTVIEEIKKCDFILDEYWSDTPMATFAAEAAYYGKPAIVCGYFAPIYKKYYPKDSCPPSMFVLPEKLYESVEKMICDRDYRTNMGIQAQKFVKKHLNCKAVASRFYKAINGEIDSKWIVDPLEMGYIEGYGIDREIQKEIIRKIYKRVGIKKMGIVGNAFLTQKVLEIVNNGEQI